LRPRAEENGLELSVDVASNVPEGVSTDATKLKQVLVNLLGNSVKFTERGYVVLRATRHAESQLRFEVEDTGRGMTPDEVVTIFDPFKQAEGGQVSGGTGLGLSISKRIIEALGGSIHVASEPGQGTCFTIELPLRETELDPSIVQDDDMLTGGRNATLAPGQDITILVADDNAANRDILVRLLESAGFTAVEASDGREAIEQLRKHDIPLALMDVRMPGMSGSDATREIRETPSLRDRKVLAVSASVFPLLQDEITDAGFDDFVSKPFRAVDIFRAIERHLGVTFIEADVTPIGESNAPSLFDPGAVPEKLAERAARRLRQLVEMGDIDSIEALADDLDNGSNAGLASELKRLVRDLDLAALEALATVLEKRARPA
jgi:CheY-like chemotaxis protein